MTEKPDCKFLKQPPHSYTGYPSRCDVPSFFGIESELDTPLCEGCPLYSPPKQQPDDSKLLPCLYCKRDDAFVDNTGDRCWEIECEWCLCTSQVFDSEEEAIKTHNQMYRKLHGDVV